MNKISYFILFVYLIVIACIFVQIREMNSSFLMSPKSTQVIEIHVKENGDVKSVYKATLDSIVQKMSDIDAKHCRNYDNALNDIRQETNNIINKFNGWMGVWIAVLALLAGILPLLAQYKAHLDAEKELAKNKEELRSEQKKAISEMKQEIEEIRRNMNTQLGNLQKQAAKNAISNVASCISAARDNRLIDDSIDRNVLWKRLLLLIKTQFRELYDIVERQDESEENIDDIELTLIQTHAILVRLLPTLVMKPKGREVQKIVDQLKVIIMDIANNKYSTTSEVLKELSPWKKDFTLLVNSLCQ